MVMKKTTDPVLLAMIICDQIIREERTKKLSLLGLFDRVYSKKFPCSHSRLHVYVALTEYIGTANCELKFSDDSGNVITKLNGPLKFPNKLTIVEMNFGIKNIPLPKAGVYHFDFIVNGRLIGHRKFKVEQIKEE